MQQSLPSSTTYQKKKKLVLFAHYIATYIDISMRVNDIANCSEMQNSTSMSDPTKTSTKTFALSKKKQKISIPYQL